MREERTPPVKTAASDGPINMTGGQLLANLVAVPFIAVAAAGWGVLGSARNTVLGHKDSLKWNAPSPEDAERLSNARTKEWAMMFLKPLVKLMAIRDPDHQPETEANGTPVPRRQAAQTGAITKDIKTQVEALNIGEALDKAALRPAISAGTDRKRPGTERG